MFIRQVTIEIDSSSCANRWNGDSDFVNRKLFLLISFVQELNIPVPDAIQANHVNDIDASTPAKRLRTDESGTKMVTEHLTGPSGTKVLALPTGTVTCNTPICELIKVVKPFIRELVEDSNLLKMWISFMSESRSKSWICSFRKTAMSNWSFFHFLLHTISVPKIEDGNNFGVAVQEETLGEIQSVESEAAAFFDQISRYFISRAKIVSKVAKYPHLDDYRRAVQVRMELQNTLFWFHKFHVSVFLLLFNRNWTKSNFWACGWSCAKFVIGIRHFTTLS